MTMVMKWFKRQAEDIEHFKPFLSVFIIICALFTVVFIQMEERRMGYAILKYSRDQRLAVEEKRMKELQLAKITRPQHVEKLAQDRFTLKKVQAKQIIQLTGASVGVKSSVNSVANSADEEIN
ncbi:MAG: hypothetical protein BroJett040_05020 [Oligoflexia bacterium]|nr:MAG: hypothetical protein BroJett040_05020 [Oligoflexia bacterium]